MNSAPDRSCASPLPPASRRERIFWLLGFAGYALFVAWNMGAYGGASDASGYANSATFLRHGHILAPQRVLAGAPPTEVAALAYVPVGFVAVPPNLLAPSYPFGLPLLVAGLSFLAGADLAPHAVMWLHTVGGVLLFFLFARQVGVSERLAALGAMLLATSPLYLGMGIQLMSDVPALFWVMGAVWWAGRAGQTRGAAVLAGVAFSLAVLIRPANVIALPALLLALRPNRNRLVALVVGGLPGALALGYLHSTAYGSPFSSGYGDASVHFGWQHWAVTWPLYARWLPIFLSPLVALALLAPFMRVPGRALLLTWIGTFLGFYASYSFTHDGEWSLRFLLPAFPPLLVAALLVVDRIAAHRLFAGSRRPVLVALAGSAALVANALVWNASLRTLDQRRSQREYVQTSAWAREHLPGNAVVVAQQVSGVLYHDTACVVVRWDQLKPGDFARIEGAARREGRKVFALTFSYEESGVMDLAPGRWIRKHRVRQTTVWQLDS